MFRVSAGRLDETKYFNDELYGCAVDGNRILHVMAFDETEAIMPGNCMEDFDRLDDFHNAKRCFILRLAGGARQLDHPHGCPHLQDKE